MTDRREAYNALMKFYPLTLDDLPDEIWRPIKRYEDFYHVSNYGRVKSFHKGKVRILKPQDNRNGYLFIGIAINSETKYCLIHRLVAQAFIPNPQGKPEVNHCDGHKLNNHVSNLEWCTASENRQHAYDTGLIPYGEMCPWAKLSNVDVKYIRDNPGGLTNRALAEIFGVTESAISQIQCGKYYKQAGGKIRDKFGVPSEIRNEIRRLYIKGDSEFGCYGLAKKFGIGHSSVWNIVHEEVD